MTWNSMLKYLSIPPPRASPNDGSNLLVLISRRVAVPSYSKSAVHPGLWTSTRAHGGSPGEARGVITARLLGALPILGR